MSVYEGVELEDYVFCGPSIVFTNVISPRSEFSQRGSRFYKKTIVRKSASIGANSTIICGNEIGKFSLIGAGAVITKSTPSYSLFVGNPGKQIGWVSEYGHRLIFDKFNEAKCIESEQIYKLNNNFVKRIK